MAKQNLVSRYLLVGLTEELADFVAVLEAVLPRYFAGASQLYLHGGLKHQHLFFSLVRCCHRLTAFTAYCQ
jgi:hypothetical protein